MAAEAKPAAAPPAKATDVHATVPQGPPAAAPLTRREFLNYTWLASLGFVFVVGFGGAAYFFSFPRFKAGEFGGVFPLGKAGEVLPKPGDAPFHNQEGKFWLANVNGAIIALYDVCVHLGCLYEWQPVTGRFECPCHGSKYQKNGTYIEGPAPRSLDRMVVQFVVGSQPIATSDAKGDALPIPSDPNADILVDTGKIVPGASHG